MQLLPLQLPQPSLIRRACLLHRWCRLWAPAGDTLRAPGRVLASWMCLPKAGSFLFRSRVLSSPFLFRSLGSLSLALSRGAFGCSVGERAPERAPERSASKPRTPTILTAVLDVWRTHTSLRRVARPILTYGDALKCPHPYFAFMPVTCFYDSLTWLLIEVASSRPSAHVQAAM